MITVLKEPRPLSLSFGIIFLSLLWSSITLAASGRYHLEVSFLPQQQSLEGRANITIPQGKTWQLDSRGLVINKIIIKEEGGDPFSMPLPQQGRIAMSASRTKLHVTINYSLRIAANDSDNQISPQGITLISNWYPRPGEAMLFSLEAKLPPGFQGISESDTAPEKTTTGILSTSFSRPLRAIHLAAGPYLIRSQTVRPGLSLSTWFFAEDQGLSQEYLTAAKSYLLRYEKEIGPFPYSHYAIVANRLPSGLGMPTFTLLGQVVLRLPFIKETSLGHELLHSWFGNSIQVSDNSGNWCEGLTSYLADYRYAEENGKGAKHRKAALITYQSYVSADSAIPLATFGSASHNQPLAKARRAVGYTRAAMLFHQLRSLIGPELFSKGLRLFARSFKGGAASWQDIQDIFAKVSNKDLSLFFTQQLTRQDIPFLTVTDIRNVERESRSILSFTLSQKTKVPYRLQVPIRITTQSGILDIRQELTESKTAISITLKEPPLSFTIDPEYDLFRHLDGSELPATWSRFIGASTKILIRGQSLSSTLDPFLLWAEQQGWPIVDDKSVSNQELSQNSLLFLGEEGAAFRSLFGSPAPDREGFSLRVTNNPLNEEKVSVVVQSSNALETTAALSKLDHYGSYSFLGFQGGRVQKKDITPRRDGLQFVLETLPMGGVSRDLRGFEDIIDQLAQRRVIYLGETHNSLADHRLQLRIIEALHKRGLDLALAMEMFPTTSQQALDRYLLQEDTLSESEFLRASRWFEVWRYDWRLFRPIFTFLRRNKIPVYGINVDRKIVSTVFKEGHTDTLTSNQKTAIAEERDLALPGYVERLRKVYGYHAEAPGSTSNGIAGFIQSQAIWDESMAENISNILKDNPDKTVIVIAGTQHTRKDSGIPPRVNRRVAVSQASVLNLYSEAPPKNPENRCDFFFLRPPMSLSAKGKIGINLKPQKDEDGNDHLSISGISSAGNAQKAGLMKGDIIRLINGKAATNMEDVGILMLDSQPGDSLSITVSRKGQGENRVEKKIKVTLSDLRKPANHP